MAEPQPQVVSLLRNSINSTVLNLPFSISTKAWSTLILCSRDIDFFRLIFKQHFHFQLIRYYWTINRQQIFFHVHSISRSLIKILYFISMILLWASSRNAMALFPYSSDVTNGFDYILHERMNGMWNGRWAVLNLCSIMQTFTSNECVCPQAQWA